MSTIDPTRALDNLLLPILRSEDETESLALLQNELAKVEKQLQLQHETIANFKKLAYGACTESLETIGKLRSQRYLIFCASHSWYTIGLKFW